LKDQQTDQLAAKFQITEHARIEDRNLRKVNRRMQMQAVMNSANIDSIRHHDRIR